MRCPQLSATPPPPHTQAALLAGGFASTLLNVALVAGLLSKRVVRACPQVLMLLLVAAHGVQVGASRIRPMCPRAPSHDNPHALMGCNQPAYTHSHPFTIAL